MEAAAPQPLVSRWSAEWEVVVRVWIDRQGKTVLGEQLADLLPAIERTKSLNAAAKWLGVSYRHAWQLLQEASEAAGEPLVTTAVGGAKGGGTQLTPLGRMALEVFQNLNGRVRQSAASSLQQAINDQSGEESATLHLAAAISLQEVVGQLLTEFALRHPAVQVRAVFGASNELADHVFAGAPCDVFLSADPVHLDRLSKAKLLRPKSRQVVALNSLAAIGPKDMDVSISQPADFLLPKVNHLVLADPISPLGKCSKAYLEQAGVYEDLLTKVIHVDNSRAVLAALRSGRAEAALAFASDAASAQDCRQLFPIEPEEAGLTYSAAVLRSATREDTAQTLLDFLDTPVGQRCFRRCGLDTRPRGRKSKS